MSQVRVKDYTGKTIHKKKRGFTTKKEALEWENNRESFQQYCMDQASYEDWKDKTLAYYASQGVEMEEPENLDTEERLKRRNALFSGK